MKLVVIILAYNEELHIARCIESVKEIASEIILVDSFSKVKMLTIASNYGVHVIQRELVNHADLFNWALTKIDPNSDWVLRIDADEYLTNELVEEIKKKINNLDHDVNGVYLNRRMTFQGRLIRFGGVFPVKVLRLFRYGKGKCEIRRMDEHIKVDGSTINFNGEMIDDNLNTLTWWIEKHNKYSNREAVDLLNLEFRFMHIESIARLTMKQDSLKRWLKEKVYTRLPLGWRAYIYFVYRYFFRLGFLDGHEGAAFHFLQAFWYRYLVDIKILEVKRYMALNNVSPAEAIRVVLKEVV